MALSKPVSIVLTVAALVGLLLWIELAGRPQPRNPFDLAQDLAITVEALRRFVSQTSFLPEMLVLVSAPYVLRSVVEVVWRRVFDALNDWCASSVKFTYLDEEGVQLSKAKGRSPGVAVGELLRYLTPWSEACEVSYLSERAAAAVALLRLSLWHLLQPTAYALALLSAWNDVSPLMRWLGVVVALREAAYAMLALGCFRRSPAFLLIDCACSWRRDPPIGFTSAAVYALAPAKLLFLLLLRSLAADTVPPSALELPDPLPEAPRPDRAPMKMPRRTELDVEAPGEAGSAVESTPENEAAATRLQARIRGRASRVAKREAMFAEETGLGAQRISPNVAGFALALDDVSVVARVDEAVAAMPSYGPRSRLFFGGGAVLALIDAFGIAATGVALSGPVPPTAYALLLAIALGSLGGAYVFSLAAWHFLAELRERLGGSFTRDATVVHARLRDVLVVTAVLAELKPRPTGVVPSLCQVCASLVREAGRGLCRRLRSLCARGGRRSMAAVQTVPGSVGRLARPIRERLRRGEPARKRCFTQWWLVCCMGCGFLELQSAMAYDEHGNAFHTLCHDMMATMDRGLVPTEAQVAAFEEHAEEALHEGESAQLVEDVRAYLRETMNSA